MNRDVIIWQDADKVLPGTDYYNTLDSFLIRYSFEPELTDCIYGVALLTKEGKFWLPEECATCEGCECKIEQRMEHLASATITHWAIIQHSKDIDD